MSSHPEIHAELEAYADGLAESEDAMLRGMTQHQRDTYWMEQKLRDEAMLSDSMTMDDISEIAKSMP